MVVEALVGGAGGGGDGVGKRTVVFGAQTPPHPSTLLCLSRITSLNPLEHFVFGFVVVFFEDFCDFCPRVLLRPKSGQIKRAVSPLS